MKSVKSVCIASLLKLIGHVASGLQTCGPPFLSVGQLCSGPGVVGPVGGVGHVVFGRTDGGVFSQDSQPPIFLVSKTKNAPKNQIANAF